MTTPASDAIQPRSRWVIDPELRRGLVELGMVRRGRVGDDGDVAVPIALTVPGCPLKAKIEGDVREVARRGRRAP